MIPTRKSAVLALSALSLFAFTQVNAAPVSDDVVRVGVITDMSSALADLSGQGSITAVRMAVEDFGGKVLGKPIEVLSADHHSKPDVASSTARKWFDVEKVDMITDLTNSAAALAAVDIAKEKNRIAIINGAGTTRITNENCTPNSIHYAWDTYAMAHGAAKAIVKNGGDTWYFLTADYAFGHQIERDVTSVVEQSGGKVVGSARHPFNANDLSSFIFSAKTSGAKIIGLANGGGDTINSIKAAREFGVDPAKQNLAGLAVFITDIHGVGLEQAQGLMLTAAFYWDLNDDTRKWSKRYYERMKKMPTAIQAANYSSTLHYLRAVEAAGTDDTAAVMAKMKSMKINDFFTKDGVIREDGRMVHDMYLMQVKTPAESKYDWDYYKVVATIPGAEAFQPLEKSTCALVKK
jgi:branched-chain amino acid transport system substrate-binding protein